MPRPERHVVTGAFGYTGRYVARRLLARGHEVVTLTGHPGRPSPFGEEVRAFPFFFDEPEKLTAVLTGAAVLYNTYWIRFAHRGVTFDDAVGNTLTLIRCAREAGVRRIVHVSITHPSESSPLPYFRGKAVLERAVTESGLAHAILRPTVVFGAEDILINNIAWLLRRLPVFCVPGSGDYRLQPVFVGDLADVMVEAGAASGNTTADAVGPEVYAFVDLVRLIAAAIGSRARIVRVYPRFGLLAARLLGLTTGDVLLTKDEMTGLMSNLLVSSGPPTGRTSLSRWLKDHAQTVGRAYASELGRHYRRPFRPLTDRRRDTSH